MKNSTRLVSLQKAFCCCYNKTDKKVYTAGRLSRDSFREINRENHFKKEFPIGNSMYIKKYTDKLIYKWPGEKKKLF